MQIVLTDMLQNSISYSKSQLAKAEILNNQKQQLYNLMIEAEEDYNKLSDMLKQINHLSDICQVYATKYHDMRINELERRCEAILELAFPDEHFGIKIESDIIRNKESSVLLLGHKNKPKSKWFPPVSVNGGLVKQLIGASVVASICEIVGTDTLFFDECFYLYYILGYLHIF